MKTGRSPAGFNVLAPTIAVLLSVAGAAIVALQPAPPSLNTGGRPSPTTTTAAPAPVEPEIGPPLDPARLPRLPTDGVAVHRETGANPEPIGPVLVGLDGAVIGHLPGGWALGERATLRRPDGTEVAISAGRLVSVRSGPAPPPPTTNAGDRECDVMLERDGDRFLACFALDPRSEAARGRATIEVIEAGGERRTIASNPPAARGLPAQGFWREASASPDDDWLLAQWSGECEALTAFFVRMDGETLREARPAAADRPFLDSRALGWAPDGRAVVHFGDGLCSEALAEPGIYLLTTEGVATRVYATGTGPDVSSNAKRWTAAG